MQKNLKDNNTYLSLKCALIIRGTIDDMEELKQKLNFKNVEIIHKGQLISKVIGYNQFDEYIYTVNGRENETFEELIARFLDDLVSKKDYIFLCSQKYEAYIRLYIQSEMAQIYVRASSEILQKLSCIKLPIELSILSWGQLK